MAPTRYPALPVVLSDAADQCLLSTPYEQYSPLSYSRFVKGVPDPVRSRMFHLCAPKQRVWCRDARRQSALGHPTRFVFHRWMLKDFVADSNSVTRTQCRSAHTAPPLLGLHPTGEQHRSQVLLSTAAVATACVAATAYLASHPSEASTGMEPGFSGLSSGSVFCSFPAPQTQFNPLLIFWHLLCGAGVSFSQFHFSQAGRCLCIMNQPPQNAPMFYYISFLLARFFGHVCSYGSDDQASMRARSQASF